MKDKHLVDLILNRTVTHQVALKRALLRAERFDCVVAFAKRSGLSPILKGLEAALKKGLVARFAVGLSFYQTEPWVLEKLLRASSRHNLKAWVSNTGSRVTFHPKIYATYGTTGGTVLIGSANLTGGGLGTNEEASARIDDADHKLFRKVASYIDGLIKDQALVELTAKRLADYRAAYVIHERYRALLQRRAKQAVAKRDTKEEVLLADFLDVMQRDESNSGYAAQWKQRLVNVAAAKKIVRAIGNAKPLGPAEFTGKFDGLLAHFHSSGISRSKPRLIAGRHRLQLSFADIYALVNRDNALSPDEAYELLRKHFLKIDGAGVNLLTEVLHALNPRRFAVMNQNAVSGLGLAGFDDFPLHPLKSSVDGARYADFCHAADSVRKKLDLPDFSALDALFNYVYWQSNTDETDLGDEVKS